MLDALNNRKTRPHVERHARDFEELFAVKTRVLHADVVGQPLDQPCHQFFIALGSDHGRYFVDVARGVKFNDISADEMSGVGAPASRGGDRQPKQIGLIVNRFASTRKFAPASSTWQSVILHASK